MSALLEKLTAAAQKEFRFDPLTEARENIYQPTQPGLMFPGGRLSMTWRANGST